MDATASRPLVTVRRTGLAYRRALIAVDLTMIGIAIAVTLALRVDASAPLPLDAPRQHIIGALVILWPLMLWETQSRALSVLATGPEEYRRILLASMWTICFTAALAYATGVSRARGTLLLAGLLGLLLLLLGRNLMRLLLHRRMRAGFALHRVYVVAPHTRHQAIEDQLVKSEGVYAQVGRWLLEGPDDPDPTMVVTNAVASGADTLVYFPASHADPDWPRRLGWAMEGADLSLLVNPALADVAGPRLSFEPLQGLPLVRVDMPRFSGPARVAKRTLDLLLATAGLFVLAIPMLVVATIINRDSPGGAFFRQQRAGAGGKTFECWKFRTMTAGADQQRALLRQHSDSDGAAFKMIEDPRITRVGRFLRRYSLDELPQLVNVLKGEMSMVGPRPHPLDDVELYDDVATRRLLAKPGMTGLWQVSGRSDLDWKEAVMLDLYYVENWTLSLDLIIIMRTTKIVLSGRGAY